MTSPRSSTKVSYRRNGRLFSCEPCRKGKLRCDHASPVCGRCTRRGKPDQCIYHPAPLTKQRPSQPAPKEPMMNLPPIFNGSSVEQGAFTIAPVPRCFPQPSAGQDGLLSPSMSSDREQDVTMNMPLSQIDGPRQSRLTYPGATDSNQISAQTCSLGTPVVDTNSQSTTAQDKRLLSSTADTIVTPESKTSYRHSKHGFMGPTAFMAVFTENSESTGFEDLWAGVEPGELTHVTIDKIQEGAEILAMLRNMPLFRQFIKRWCGLYDGLIVPQPMFKIWVDDLWNECEPIFTRGTPAQLSRLSEHVFKNTRLPIKTHQYMSAMEYSRAVTGRNVRWEVIGLILSLVGVIAVNMNDWDDILDDMQETPLDRATFAEDMRKMSERCVCFCYECEALNDIYVYLMHQDLVLVNCMKGNIHYAAWQRTGELIDTVVALGLHRGNYVDAQTPFWLSELRRKLFVSSFSRDKTVASFLGRPPRLSYRYCKLEMPLDLTDHELFMGGAELEAAMALLDEHGWHTSGRLSRKTWTRIWFQECLIREEILEIAMGSGDDDLEERVEKVRLKLARVHQTFPASMRLTPDEILDSGSVGTANRSDRFARQINAVYIICISSGLLLTEFLLQRAVVNRGKADTKTLVPVARKLLQNVLLAQTRRDLFKDFRGDAIFLLASYGLPSAGVLAIELLKQEQTRQYEPELLSKSETIQDLSIYISALASVSPGEGNYDTCNQGRRALKRVLDQILTPPPPAINKPALDDMSLYFPTGNDADFLQWLDNVDWDKNTMVPPLQQIS